MLATQAARTKLRNHTLLATSNPHPNAPRSAPPIVEEATSEQRKLSRATSSQGTRGFLGSRRLRRAEEEAGLEAPTRSQTMPVIHGYEGKGKGREHSESQHPPPSMPFRSIVPDPLGELPAWYTMDAELATPTTQFKSKYSLHNPVGPRWYRNHHLKPPTPGKRPPSVFSPSFPPMAARAELSQDATKLAGPSRTPSGSPMPSPNSSQVRIHDVRTRTRKISQTNADGLDASDPIGINWHHHSPYDVGRRSHEKLPTDSPVSIESPTSTASRPRRMSMTTVARHKTVVPSPLSQSTSAVHLASEPLTVSTPRRLSRRRKPFRGLFGSSSEPEVHSQSTSNPGTPIEISNILGRKVSRAGSIVPASITSSTGSVAPTEKRRRGSVLGRLVKRFSVLRKSDATNSMTTSITSARPSVSDSVDVSTPTSTGRVSPQKPPPLQRSHSSEASKHLPSPSIQTQNTQRSAEEEAIKDTGDGQSISSTEGFSLSIGKLMVANPDIFPSGKEDSPNVEAPPSQQYGNILDSPLCSSPSSLPNAPRYPPPPLSVISERETIMSSPRMPTIVSPKIPSGSPVVVPMSPVAMPSVLAPWVAPASRVAPNSVPAPASSPPLPDLPPPTPVMRKSKMDASLPPTPAHTRPSSPSLEVPSLPPMPTLPNPNGRHSIATMSPSGMSTTLSKAEDPALARASMYVNPPTPYVPAIVIPQSPAPQVSSAPTSDGHARAHSQDKYQSTRDPSPTKKDSTHRVKRRTETFKLVRSSSGNVKTVGGGSFVVAGEHWGVVESSEHKARKERSKSTDLDSANGKEGKKHEKEKESTDDDSERQRKHRRKSVRQSSDAEPTASQHHVRTPTSETGRRGFASERHRSTREKESVPDTMRSTQTPVIYAQPTTSPNSAYRPTTNYSTAATSTRVERRTSTSTRPASEFQSAADLNALKAKEAWEMERLWKGRSMIYGPEGGAGLVNTRPNIGSDSRPSTIMSADLHRASTIPSVGDLSNASTATIPLNNGSSHTYFMVQAPYNGTPPATHPSLIYSGLPASSQHAQSPSAHFDLPKSYPFPSAPDRPSPRSNPLPEPPRLSSYRASPLPPSLAGPGEGSSSPDYWTKYAGVTTH